MTTVAPGANQVDPKAGSDNGAQKTATTGQTAAAKSAKPEVPQQLGPGQVTKGVLITNTLVVDKTRQGGGLSYEIHGHTGEAGRVGVEQIWHTPDEQLYKAAASCEGSDSRFNVTWHTASTKDRKREIKVITGLEAAS